MGMDVSEREQFRVQIQAMISEGCPEVEIRGSLTKAGFHKGACTSLLKDAERSLGFRPPINELNIRHNWMVLTWHANRLSRSVDYKEDPLTGLKIADKLANWMIFDPTKKMGPTVNVYGNVSNTNTNTSQSLHLANNAEVDPVSVLGDGQNIAGLPDSVRKMMGLKVQQTEDQVVVIDDAEAERIIEESKAEYMRSIAPKEPKKQEEVPDS